MVLRLLSNAFCGQLLWITIVKDQDTPITAAPFIVWRLLSCIIQRGFLRVWYDAIERIGANASLKSIVASRFGHSAFVAEQLQLLRLHVIYMWLVDISRSNEHRSLSAHVRCHVNSSQLFHIDVMWLIRDWPAADYNANNRRNCFEAQRMDKWMCVRSRIGWRRSLMGLMMDTKHFAEWYRLDCNEIRNIII